jgi:small subunit ribosomal protein S20
MPVTRSARKKLKVDRKRESANKKIEAFINSTIKKAQRKPTPGNIQKAFKVIDKGVKKNIFHKNKASRIKSRLSKPIVKKIQSSTNAKILKSTKAASDVTRKKEIRKNKK